MASALLTILVLHVAALVIPGQNVLVISQLAASDGRRTASYAALGITLGAAIWSTTAILGVVTLFNSATTTRTLLQIIGSLYLLYVAFRIWRTTSSYSAGVTRLSDRSAFRTGLLTNLTNPKSPLFFVSIFSAALPSMPSPLMVVLAVLLAVFNALWWHLLVAFVFSHGLVQRAYERHRKALSRISSATIGVLGVSLLVSALREVPA